MANQNFTMDKLSKVMEQIGKHLRNKKSNLDKDLFQFMQRQYHEVIIKKNYPDLQDQQRIMDYFIELQKQELETIDKIICTEIKSKEQGEFQCPICGGKAWYKLYNHSWPGIKNGKGIAASCENKCFSMRS